MVRGAIEVQPKKQNKIIATEMSRSIRLRRAHSEFFMSPRTLNSTLFRKQNFVSNRRITPVPPLSLFGVRALPALELHQRLRFCRPRLSGLATGLTPELSATSVRQMKTITLRTLVREPLKVKRITRAGKSVQVTDNGVPLWILHPANGTEADEERRRREIEEELAEVLRGPRSKMPLSKIVLQSRR
jgi:hypothetical protein